MRILHVTDAVEFSGGVKQLMHLMKGLEAINDKREADGNSNQLSVISKQLEAKTDNRSPITDYRSNVSRFTFHVLQQELIAPPGAVADRFKHEGFIVHEVKMFQDYDLIAAFKILRIIRDFKPDIVHAHHPKAHALVLIARYFTSFSLIVSRRVTHPIRPFPTSSWKYRSSLIERFIAVSCAVKATLIAGGVTDKKIVVIPSATDFERFKPSSPPTPNPQPSTIRLGVIANYSPWKGHDLVLDALSLIKKSQESRVASRELEERTKEGSDSRLSFLPAMSPDSRLATRDSRLSPIICVFAGRDTNTDEFRKKVQDRGLKDCVQLLGFREDVDQILSELDCLICPALSGEGLSGAIREAYASKIPVVASSIAANLDLVDESKGYLFEALNPRSLANAIDRFIGSSNDVKKEKIETAYQFAISKFSIQGLVDKTLQLYQSALT